MTIPVLKKDGSVQFSGGSKTVITGSYLEILQPDCAVWDEGVSSYIYPFIFTADSTWEVDVCTQVPQGYTIVGVYDSNGTLLSQTNCAQTLVADESKVIAFDVVDLESPPPHVKTRFKIKHKGKLHQFDLDVPGRRNGKDKKPGQGRGAAKR